MRNLKILIKQLISFFFHPILLSKLYLQKRIKPTGYFIIRGHININTIKYIHFGSNIEICNNARFLCVSQYRNVSYSPNIKIGNNIFIGYNFSLLCASNIFIEDNVLIASNVLISSENHCINPMISESYGNTPLETKPVHIKEGCWLGEKCVILPGVTLGKRCIVAAGAVVTKSFPEYCIIAGVPAKCIKRFNKKKQTWEKV